LLLAAIADLPRESFVPDDRKALAYADEDIPLGGGRFLMEPMVLARLIQNLQPGTEDKALVVASGRGYGAALLARLVKTVVAVETDEGMIGAARETMKELGIRNVRQVRADPVAGMPSEAPYDAILIEGGVREVPKAILDQLAEGGRLGTVIAGAPGVLGVAHLVVKDGGIASGRPLFEAGTPVLPGFAQPPRFAF
jgi:protein-L-isoaspartate(D-aspartate) O-methyltransferase